MTHPRVIVHLDADAFFASVEQASDPRLRGKPIAVGGEKRGIIASASYEARRLGIYTPMPTAQARRLYPKLIVLPGDFDKYELFSRLMFSYAYDFTPDVEIGSIDEGYFDLTGTRKPALPIARAIRDAIRQSLKLPVSQGIGGSKLVSQIASKLKKPFAFQWVPAGQEQPFLAPLEARWLPGVGPQTAQQLRSAGLQFIGQIARTPVDLLGLITGGLAPQLKRFSLGIDDRPVISARVPAKSYGAQETFAADTTDEPFIEATLRRMADQLMAKVRADAKSIRTLTVKARYNDMDEDQASESLPEPTDLETDVYGKISLLLRRAWKRRASLRLVSLRLSNVYHGRCFSGLSLDADSRRRDANLRLSGAVDELRKKFGRDTLFRGHDFILRLKGGRGEEPGPASSARVAELNDPPEPRMLAARRPPRKVSLPADSSNRVLLPRPQPPARQPGTRTVSRAPRWLPLNVHSGYSFLDSTLSIQAIVELARRHELPAIALTDTHNLHGAVEFAQAARAAGIKPIIGAELRCRGRSLCLYVENDRGYQNLCRILTRDEASADPAEIESEKTLAQPLTGLEEFGETRGLIAVSSAPELARAFPGAFYLETSHPEAHEKRRGSLPCLAAPPIHYADAADRRRYDIVQSIRTRTLLRQAHPGKRLGGEFHFRSGPEMSRLFTGTSAPLERGWEIAERCSFEFPFGRPQFPPYAPPDGSTPAGFLRQLALAGLRRRYPETHARLRPQIEEELAIITEVGYEEYFLVMWDILQECRRRGIEWITRGSAADSLVCYCLEISGVCPIRFDLYFRRFLNRDRMALKKLPDIDVDFPHDRKDDVIDLIFEKYGSEQTAVVGGFSTFQARSAFAEVAKVLGAPEHQIRRLTERFPHYTRVGDLAGAVADVQECRGLPLDQEPFSTALQMARFLDGFPRYPKMHPCGLVLSRQPMRQITPCFQSAKGYPTTHFDMDAVEAMGLIKMDILAQGGLAVMRDARQLVLHRDAEKRATATPETSKSKEPANAAVNPPIELTAHPDWLEPWDDPAVWDLIASGQARAVHHIESPAMISLCKMCAVRDIDTLIAIVSVIRPGAANESKKMEFARRYQGLAPTRYPHPSLEKCLRGTCGLVVYEEHILQICETFAGLPPGRADLLRRALAKEKIDVIEQIRAEFTSGARQAGRTGLETSQVWDLIAGFRGYAFCKAHSTAYGVEAYQSAWLKRYYPAEFMAAVLTHGKGFYHPLVYVLECHRLGIPLLPPTVNKPGPAFAVSTRSDGVRQIRVPVSRLKGITIRTGETITREREREPFRSLADFMARVKPLPEEMESLIRAGVFDEFGESRAAQYWQCKSLAAISETRPSGARKNPPPSRAAQQLWLLAPADLDRLSSVPLTQPTRLARLRAEEELLGYCASGHPLELFPDIAWETYCPIASLDRHLGERVVTCGLVVEQRLFHQVTGEPMKFLTIADHTGMVETELFSRAYQACGLNTVRYRVLEITATVEPFENGRGHTLRVHHAGKPRTRSSGGRPAPPETR